MARHPMIRPFLLLGFMTPIVDAQPSAKLPVGPYKVAFWYEADRPTTSLKYQVYDLAKGEYDEKAVDRWLRTILNKYPNHGAYARDIQTRGEPGATEQERLASAIEREKRRWADLQRQASRSVPGLIETSATVYQKPRTETPSRTSFDRPAPGSPGIMSRPPTSPFPYPYRSGPR